MYRIGMDGGGTRTRLAVFEGEKERFRCETGGINYNSFSAGEIRAHLAEAVSAMVQSGFPVVDCEGVGIGAAGVSNPEAAPFLQQVLTELGFTCPVVVEGDQDAALAGAVGAEAGILLIAGTGSVCVGKDAKGNKYRSGGFGHIIDDAGSAYAVGRDILTAIVRAEDGRGAETALRVPVFEALQVKDTGELISYLYSSDRTKKDIAALAVCLSEELILSDTAAGEIAKHAVEEQALLVQAVLRKMGALDASEKEKKAIPLLLEGGLILKNKIVNTMFWEKLKEKNLPVCPAEKSRDAAYGASTFV